ncbi:MAG: UDP-N-acetylmuramoyl-L-alanyl-D-glutamate--2,6-diaminopimelate ligase [Candidatus Latescibacterota bacterium]
MTKAHETMKLSLLLQALDEGNATDCADVEVCGVTSDSRMVEKGFVFVALKGTSRDGHAYLREAIDNGAVACVTEMPVDVEGTVRVVVKNSARALARLAAKFFGNPSASLIACGVTGTNGKTSTAHLLRSIVNASSWGEMGVIGTIGHGSGEKFIKASHTTPEPVTMQRLLRDMKDKGCRGVVMEVSSHAVRQQRTWGIDFKVGILTNVTRDHLDYHTDIEDYVAAKREFCHSLIGPPYQAAAGTLVYWNDNARARAIGESFSGRKISVSEDEESDIRVSDIDASLNGTRFTLRLPDGGELTVNLTLLGRFTVANASLAAGAAHVLGIPPRDIKRGLEALPRVPGRFETLGGGEQPLIVVDYCHTPDSVEMTLKFCLDLEPGRLSAVFGCGGDRDRGKRPLIGRIVQELSDACFITEDNSRSESFDQILADILSGMNQDAAGLHVIRDRSEAIRLAIEQSQAGDVVAILGKGHEDYQMIGTEKIYFSDREEAQKALERGRER